MAVEETFRFRYWHIHGMSCFHCDVFAHSGFCKSSSLLRASAFAQDCASRAALTLQTSLDMQILYPTLVLPWSLCFAANSTFMSKETGQSCFVHLPQCSNMTVERNADFKNHNGTTNTCIYTIWSLPVLLKFEIQSCGVDSQWKLKCVLPVSFSSLRLGGSTCNRVKYVTGHWWQR